RARPAADLPRGLACGRARTWTAAESLASGAVGASWVIRFPMPYRSQGLLRIDTAAPLAGRVRVRTTRGVVSDAGYFRAAVWSPAAGRDRVGETARGHLAGLLLATERPEGLGTGGDAGRL